MLQQSKSQKIDQLRRTLFGKAHLVRLNAQGMEHASQLLDANPNLSVQDIIDRVDNLVHMPADRI